jgi:HPt (histidine-containing phosphotransfer) domain-containing protein
MTDIMINWESFAETRNSLGPQLVRILGYFREDGLKSVAAIEEAMRLGNSAALVIPAHTLKGESFQFGAEKLGELAEGIEISARRFVEMQQTPEELLAQVVQLRPTFEATLNALEQEFSPLVERRAMVSARNMNGLSQFGRI